jgi:pyruvate kinase
MMDWIAAVIEHETDDFELILRNSCRAALKKGLVSDPNDLLVVTAGIPFGTPGAANVIRVMPAAGPNCWNGVCRAD